MASGACRRQRGVPIGGPSAWWCVVALLGAAVAVGAYRLRYPAFDELRVLRTAVAAAGAKRVEFEVRGRNLFAGLPVRTTRVAAARDAGCGGDGERDVREVSVDEDGRRAVYSVIVPARTERRGGGSVYFCLPRGAASAAADGGDERGDVEIVRPALRAWSHQGDNIAIDSEIWLAGDPDTDLDYRDKTISRGRRQDENDIDKLRVTGLRVDVAPKEPHFDDDGIPFLLVGAEYTLRLFGVGFSENTQITFTQQKGSFGSACQIPVTGIFQAIKGSISADSVRVSVRIPMVENADPLYVCIKEGTSERTAESEPVLKSSPFVHQGSAPWLSVHSYQKGLPLWAALIIICVCLCFSALFSGLNLGLMSLDRTELKILCNTGTEQERRYAKKIQPVRNHGNFLLCSILLGNVLVNSTFTILLDDLTSGVIAVVCSTLAIVMFGEITPQAICSRHGLAIGAKTIVITKMVMAVTFPLSYPISRVLDVILGEEIGSVYTRERLKELVKVTTGENDLDKDEVNIISGALELRRKTVADVMTKIEDAFMLSYDAVLDFETVSEIMKSGYSRIPVYELDRENNRKNIITTLYIKDLAFVDPDDNTPLKTLCQFYQNPCNFVFEDVTLDIMFKDFKEGNKGHMAFINRINSEGEGDPFYETIGLITLEDVIEELIQAEIMDETDVFTDNRTKRKRNADRTKQDFTVFAERKNESNRIRISPQLTLATYQYLSTSIEMFKPHVISETILRRLLKQDVYHHIKKNKDWRNDPSTIIYQQRVQADYFVLVLEGRVEVKVGDENLTFESGPFTYFGTQALKQTIAAAESPATIGSLQSLNLDSNAKHTFLPDFTVRACTEVLYLKLKRNLYFAAKRASLMEMSQRDSVTNGDAFDDEVEKFYDRSDAKRSNFNVSSPPDPDTEANQLLHSFDDDGSIGRRSPDIKQQDGREKPLRGQTSGESNVGSASAERVNAAASPRTPSLHSHAASPTSGARTFGARDANGSVKHTPAPPDDAAGASEREEEVSLLSTKS